MQLEERPQAGALRLQAIISSGLKRTETERGQYRQNTGRYETQWGAIAWSKYSKGYGTSGLR